MIDYSVIKETDINLIIKTNIYYMDLMLRLWSTEGLQFKHCGSNYYVFAIGKSGDSLIVRLGKYE